MKEQKTNAMRILEQKKIPYASHDYPYGDGPVDGVTVAALTGKPQETVFKTLVTVGASRNHYVFVIPVAKELDLKKAAAAVGEKSIAMIHGYVRGGCSPVGMKKLFRTVFDASADDIATIQVSGGRIGTQIELAPADLIALVKGETADITTKE